MSKSGKKLWRQSEREDTNLLYRKSYIKETKGGGVDHVQVLRQGRWRIKRLMKKRPRASENTDHLVWWMLIFRSVCEAWNELRDLFSIDSRTWGWDPCKFVGFYQDSKGNFLVNCSTHVICVYSHLTQWKGLNLVYYTFSIHPSLI